MHQTAQFLSLVSLRKVELEWQRVLHLCKIIYFFREPSKHGPPPLPPSYFADAVGPLLEVVTPPKERCAAPQRQRGTLAERH